VASITPSAHLPQTKPAFKTDTTVGLIDCGKWMVSASWAVPSTATSGIYFAQVVRSETGRRQSYFLIVRDDSSCFRPRMRLGKPITTTARVASIARRVQPGT
jgi:hypothetical protein